MEALAYAWIVINSAQFAQPLEMETARLVLLTRLSQEDRALVMPAFIQIQDPVMLVIQLAMAVVQQVLITVITAQLGLILTQALASAKVFVLLLNILTLA